MTSLSERVHRSDGWTPALVAAMEVCSGSAHSGGAVPMPQGCKGRLGGASVCVRALTNSMWGSQGVAVAPPAWDCSWTCNPPQSSDGRQAEVGASVPVDEVLFPGGWLLRTH